MRGKVTAIGSVILMLALCLIPSVVSAQATSVEWNRWDADITVQSNSEQIQIVEKQEVKVVTGTVRFGRRGWTTPVQIQTVFVSIGNSQPRQLTEANDNAPGTYSLTQSGGEYVLRYNLDPAQNAGDTYFVQISYTAASPTTGMVDWIVIPTNRDFPVRSSTVRIRFPQGQVPDVSLARVVRGNGAAQINGNEIVIQLQGTVAPQQAFAIQIPFGPGVGAPAQGGESGGVNPGQQPVDPGAVPGDPGTVIEVPGGLGSLLMILCVIGFLVLIGGGGLLRGLLGGGSPFGGRGTGYDPGYDPGYGPYPGDETRPSTPTLRRGLRPSATPDRNIGRVGSDKDSGGSSSFG
jgi:hypothetical protein